MTKPLRLIDGVHSRLLNSFIASIAALLLFGAPMANAAPVCSTGSDGTVVIGSSGTRVNVYYAAPDPALTTTVAAGSTSIPVDVALGAQATNLHPSISSTISAGDILIVVQMIGAEINTSNNHQSTGNYGDGAGGLVQAGTLNSANLVAGRYEFVIATGPIAGGLIPIEGAGAGNGLINQYVNSNATTATLGFRRYQVIKVPQFSKLRITGEVVSDRWNGRWGGVSALNVREDLNLQGGSFNANGRGFRGGQFFPDRSDNAESAVNGNFGFKGEGIAGMPQRLFSRVLLAEQPATNGEELGPTGYAGTDNLGPAGTSWTRDTGQGAPGNAGSGGGGGEDAGGGGGANFARGGGGGRGVDGAGTQGIGGAMFPQHFASTANAMVMGGGGGASNGNDTAALDLRVSSGQAGGGIVFVRSVGIVATGGGLVSANGDSGGTAASEGGGGGGAGGTVVVHTDNSTVDGIAFTAIGGRGGSSLQTDDGGGGGGSGGVVWLSDTSLGSATFDISGGAAGTGASGGFFNGSVGGNGNQSSIAPIAPFDCNFVTLGIAKALTSQTRVGSGNVFDLVFTLTVENFSANPAINVQVTDDLAAAFPNAASITIQGVPSLGGFSASATAYDGTTQTDLLAGTDTMPGNSVRVLTYTVRVDFDADTTGPFTTQASVTSSQIPNGFAQVLDLSDAGVEPDTDGDGDPSETFANGGDSEENDATPVVLDLSVAPAACTFTPNPAYLADSVSASCTGVETNGAVAIAGMVCGAEAGGTVTCTGTASDIGSIPDITTTDIVGNSTTAPGDLLVLPDTDGDGIPDVIEGPGDSDGDGIPDALDTDSDNDGIPDNDEENSLPPLTGLDGDGDGIDDAIDVDVTGGEDLDGDGIDDAFTPDDFDADGIPDYLDIDSDNDRIPDILEGNGDVDGDSAPNYLDLDSDFDGIPDSFEADNVPDLLGVDTDLDGIDDALDVDQTGGVDIDGDGVDDLLQPVDTDADGTPDYLDTDSDADGIPDAIEGIVDTDSDGTADWRDVDSDNDGILDSAEGPAGNDADLDGIDDAYDADTTGETDADGNGVVDDLLSVDANADGIPDADTDNDGVPDYRDLDSDNDGINDVDEAGITDVNEDGLADAGTTPVGAGALPDADADGIPDFQEVDSDNDGTFDIAGTPNAGFDTNNDGRVDDATDTDGDGIADVVDGAPNGFGDASTILPTDADGDGIADAIEGTGDTDGDGIPDYLDTDSDNDAIPDSIEEMNQPPLTGDDSDADGIDDAIDVDNTGGTDANADGIDDAFTPLDSDGDGLPNYRDLDSDDDGIQDSYERNIDTDGDGIPDYLDTDSDSDGIPDFMEADNLPPETGLDADSDGIDDAFDVDISGGTDANANGFDDALEPVDTDADGLPDFRDIDSDNDGIPDAIEGVIDTDNDGVADWRDVDSDNDGILDSAEGPSGADIDADGIDDAYDADVTGQADVDGNGIVDNVLSVDADFNGIPDADTDDDGVPDYRDLDSDNDGINDVEEAGQPDVDLDGQVDAGNAPIGLGALPDSDADGIPDFQEVDSNNDGTFDIEGTPSAGLDGNGDGRIDNATDSDGDGIPDVADGMPGNFGDAADSDHDGISDLDEGRAAATDTDNDMIPDYLDLDSDNDGIPDELETDNDFDGDGIGNFRDTDSDNDGIDDATESDRVPPISNNDVDSDGIPDEVDVNNTGGIDADGNGVDDALEPNDTDDDGSPDYLDTDSDDDGIPDIIETTVDTDADNIGDWRDSDSDNDGIDDNVEGDNVPPLSGIDTDGDGIDDALDVDETGGQDANGNGIDDTAEPVDTDDDGTPDFRDDDSDNDTIPDLTEGTTDTDGDGTGNWRDSDSDNDGVSDEDEGTVDTDNDGMADYIDTDSDGDGIPDAIDAGDKDNDGIDDRIDANEGQLRTAVRGSGSIDLSSLLMLALFAALIVYRRRHTGPLLVALCLIAPFNPGGQAIADDQVCADTGGEFESCWYGGLGAGITHVDPEGQASGWSTNDNRDTGWKLFGGFQFHPRWSVELSYVDGGEAGLGNVDPALEALIPNASIDYATPSLMAVRWLNAPQSKWNAFAKLGASAIDNNASDSRIPYEKQTDVQLAAGIGAQARFSERFFVRGDIDFYDRDHYYAGLSIGGYFGSVNRPVPTPAAEVLPPKPAPAPAPVEKPTPAPLPPPVAEPVCEDVVSTLAGVNFENNSDTLRPESREVLDEVVQKLRSSPGDTLRILAHTDSNGSEEYNLGLSIRRAKSVEDFFANNGVARARLSYAGLGEMQPIDTNDSAEGRARNRRVELVWTAEHCQ